jgi:hypothetical protein
MNAQQAYADVRDGVAIGRTARSTLSYAGEVGQISQPALNAHLGRLTMIADRLGQSGSNVRDFADRIHGARPESDVACGNPSRCGLMGSIEDVADTLSDRLDFLESEVARLNGIA